jgi:hypothetical protein
MKLNLAGATSAGKKESSHDEATKHETIAVTFEFSSESMAAETYNISAGDTFAQIKKRIADSKRIPYVDITFTLAGKTLIDPLCLSDVKEIKGKDKVTIETRIK